MVASFVEPRKPKLLAKKNTPKFVRRFLHRQRPVTEARVISIDELAFLACPVVVGLRVELYVRGRRPTGEALGDIESAHTRRKSQLDGHRE